MMPDGQGKPMSMQGPYLGKPQRMTWRKSEWDVFSAPDAKLYAGVSKSFVPTIACKAKY